MNLTEKHKEIRHAPGGRGDHLCRIGPGSVRAALALGMHADAGLTSRQHRSVEGTEAAFGPTTGHGL